MLRGNVSNLQYLTFFVVENQILVGKLDYPLLLRADRSQAYNRVTTLT